MMLSILSCVCRPSVYLLWRNVHLNLQHSFKKSLFIFQLLSYRSSLYILEISSLSDICFENMSLFLRSSFHSVDSSLYCGEAFQFGVVPLIYFCFCCLCFWCHLHEIIVKTNVIKIFLILSSRIFTVLGLMFKSLIHFELIFVMVLGSVLISFMRVAVQFSQHHLLKRLSFLHCIFLPQIGRAHV